ncbi:MAG: hypothetical protein KBT02_10690, partial [Treponema sp.]|nr:hypothetical protein [Candidatus Treponema caballi]
QEFDTESIQQYESLFQIYMTIISSFFKGVYLGVLRSPPKDLHNKARELRINYTRGQLIFIDVYCDMLNGRSI